MDDANLLAEIDANYDAFKARLDEYMADHAGEWALLKGGKVVDFFPTMDAAIEKGEGFSDKLFSIQRVSKKTVEEGYFRSVAHTG